MENLKTEVNKGRQIDWRKLSDRLEKIVYTRNGKIKKFQGILY